MAEAGLSSRERAVCRSVVAMIDGTFVGELSRLTEAQAQAG